MKKTTVLIPVCGLLAGLSGVCAVALGGPQYFPPDLGRLSVGRTYINAGGSAKSMDLSGINGRIQATFVGGTFGGSTPMRYREIDAQGNPVTDQINLTPGSASLFGGSASFPLGELNLVYLVELPAADPNEANVYFGSLTTELLPISAILANQRALGVATLRATGPFAAALIYAENFRINVVPATTDGNGAPVLGDEGQRFALDQTGNLGDGFAIGIGLVPFHFRKGGGSAALALAVWSSVGAAGADASGASIQGRMINDLVQPVGDQFLINDVTAGSQFRPRVAVNSSGNAAVVWTSESSAGSNNEALSIQARLLDANGAFAGPQFQVNQSTAGFQVLPDVAMDESGNFIVVWQDQDPLTGSLIYGRAFFADGSAASDDVLLSDSERGNVTFPRVILGPANVAVGYAEDGNLIVRGSYPAFFKNGFESGIVQ